MEPMRSWFQRLFGAGGVLPPLRGVPSVRRVKNHSALSGYAYEYFFEGFRDRPGERTYEFMASGDRKNWFRLEVAVPDTALAGWERRQGRRLGSSERYGVAKLALLAAFDERAGPDAMRRPPIRVSGELMEEIAGRLGLD
jgi:hypothetical protein